LFQGTTVGLWNKEVNPHEGKGAEAAKENVGAKLDVLNHWRRDQSLEPLEEILFLVWNGSLILTMMKLLPQLDIVPKAHPLARSEDGKISAGIAQGIGPQVPPKVNMKKRRKPALAHPAAL
jgi:hypothetical protein